MRKLLVLGLVILSALPAGCSRTRYRMAADQDSYCLLEQKVGGQPWAPPSDYTLHPAPTSRLYDPTPLDDPLLPSPAPQLYAYKLPELSSRNPRPSGQHQTPGPIEEMSAPPPVHIDPQARVIRLPTPSATRTHEVQLANHLALPAVGISPVQSATWQNPVVVPPTGAAPSPAAAARSRNESQNTYMSDIRVDPVPSTAWDAIPSASRTRMFEFEKLRQEYRMTYAVTEPPQDQLAPGQRLSLEDIVELTLLNSREYQTEKETLYRAALRLSLERFAYQLRFSPFANGTDVNWSHLRTGGETVNTLSIPTRFQVEKMLASGGDFIARFANDVVLTFNGPNGFAADVGSDLFLQLDQTIFQRDVRFESLTQAERDVIYAARDFLRFRKILFTQLASQYYNLIRTYRQVEIDSQNYFALVRAFQQSQAEFRTSFLPRFQLDQVEQNVLSGRSRLIATSNNLESVLDNLKIRIGLPTETPINIDLTELEQLTSRDELSVGGELIRRVRVRLIEDRNARELSRVVLLSSSIVVVERILEIRPLMQRTGVPSTELDDLPQLLHRLQIEAARENSAVMRQELLQESMAQPPSYPILFQRTMDLIDALLELTTRQINLAEAISGTQQSVEASRQRSEQFRMRAAQLGEELATLIEMNRLAELPALVDRASELRTSIDQTSAELDQLLGFPAERPPAEEEMRQTIAIADELVNRSENILKNLQSGLTPIAIDLDAAMLTALNLRLDLMNERGNVADNWRQIKYAGDDLRSILNISASQRISTRRDVNRVFDFTLDESETRVGASFDLPFNRFAQRNIFRQALIDYQVSLRQLMQLEDDIKLDVRNDLRNLSLDKEQYAIEVASAALAYERVGSVLLELRLGIGQAATRDFLEAQNAYASSLSNVASRHIGYIIDRTQLFLDMELLNVGDDGFWDQLYEEKYQPEPYYQLPPYASPVYGELVPGLWYSRWIRRMEQVPPGVSAIHETPAARNDGEEIIPVPAELQPVPE